MVPPVSAIDGTRPSACTATSFATISAATREASASDDGQHLDPWAHAEASFTSRFAAAA